MKNRANIVLAVGERKFRVCYARKDMLSKCFNCSAAERFRPPAVIRCGGDAPHYFKEVTDERKA